MNNCEGCVFAFNCIACNGVFKCPCCYCRSNKKCQNVNPIADNYTTEEDCKNAKPGDREKHT